MMKRNEGYTLAYVVVVLGVMATVALATMALALMPQKSLHASLERMQDNYEVQGLVEQIIGQLSHAKDKTEVENILSHYDNPDSNIYGTSTVTENGVWTCTITAKTAKRTATATFLLTPDIKEFTEGDTKTTLPYHIVTYTSYKIAVVSENAENSESEVPES